MLKERYCLKFLFLLCLLSVSCESDDTYTALPISTTDDVVQLCSNSNMDIAVLENDNHVPEGAVLSVDAPSNGTATVMDSGTPNDGSDDFIHYSPNDGFSGSDAFSYTVCSNSNCATSQVTVNVAPESTVSFNWDAEPYQTLSEYHFFEGNLNNLSPVPGVLPYDLVSPLFSDYAHKKRFVWMPCGTAANYVDDYSPLDFPSGAVLIKTFYYDNVLPNLDQKILETRLMYKTDDGWEFAEYVWNEAQTEAHFTTAGSFVELQWMENDQTNAVNYRIPSESECFTCHNKFGTPLPIGPKPQNLDKNFPYTDGAEHQLTKWIAQGYLSDNLPATIDSTVDWEDTSQSLELRVRSYLDINCAHCHSEQSYCEYRPMRFAFSENDDDTNKGVCVTPDTQIEPFTKIIAPGNLNNSLLLFRISSVEEQYRMPLLGRSLKHAEGVRLIEEWINSLNYECE